MFKSFQKYLDYENVFLVNQQTIIHEALRYLETERFDMQKLKSFLIKEMQASIDEAGLLESYETYEMSFIHYNRINNSQKQLDAIFEGAVKYLELLREAFDKEI